MATIKPKTLDTEGGERSHRIRITLTSQNVAALEKGEGCTQCDDEHTHQF